MIIALFIFIGILMLSLIFAYTISSVLNSDKIHSEPAMDAIIQTNLALMTTSTIDLIGDIVSIAIGKTMVFLHMFGVYAKRLAQPLEEFGGQHFRATFWWSSEDTFC